MAIGDQVLIFKDTELVRWNNLRIVVRHGGWKTATTKARINQCAQQNDLGFRVILRGYDWYVWVESTGEKRPFNIDAVTIYRGAHA